MSGKLIPNSSALIPKRFKCRPLSYINPFSSKQIFLRYAIECISKIYTLYLKIFTPSYNYLEKRKFEFFFTTKICRIITHFLSLFGTKNTFFRTILIKYSILVCSLGTGLNIPEVKKAFVPPFFYIYINDFLTILAFMHEKIWKLFLQRMLVLKIYHFRHFLA